MCFDPEIQKRVNRKEMQMKAQKTHTGEERWTNVDSHFIEVCSSSCAIVGFSVGYSVALGKKNNGLCQSRQGDAEVTIDWDLMPHKLDEKNTEITEKRQKRESEIRGAEDSCKDEPEEDEPEDDETDEDEPATVAGAPGCWCSIV